MEPVYEHNRAAWDARVRNRARHTVLADDKDFANARVCIDPWGWLPARLTGLRVLCLAGGGGRHGMLLAACGAEVTIVDISGEMLELDQKVAAERGLKVRTMRASMDDLPMFGAATFDVVWQPVSTCYVPDVKRVYREVARLLVPGGTYFSKHKQPVNLQTSLRPGPGGYVLNETVYRSEPLPPSEPGPHREVDTLEYVHSLGDILGGLCEAGFRIEALNEPQVGRMGSDPGSFAHRSLYAPPYLEIKAVRSENAPAESGSKLWVPG
ncbi:MAG TPA: class I SAM-dependent methyltransferase [Roseimicrobium sp.]|nr:class I SAM-dependent methyltransferase [Roseimicrobium sp.]